VYDVVPQANSNVAAASRLKNLAFMVNRFSEKISFEPAAPNFLPDIILF
jgi:hypothetical protein